MGTNNSYPFTTKRDIVKKLQSGDRKIIAEFMKVMQERHERRLAGDAGTGACGWMASQASTASKLAKKILSGEASDADWTTAVRTLSPYVKQIAAHYRSIELEQNPALAEAAKTFGLLGTPGVARPKKPRPVTKTAVRVAAPAPGPEPEPEATPLPEPVAAPSAPVPLSERVLGAVREARGGLRCEEVAKALSISTAETGTALRELVDTRKVRKHGAGRGTRYAAR